MALHPSWLRCLRLNLGPQACQACTLPLGYAQSLFIPFPKVNSSLKNILKDLPLPGVKDSKLLAVFVSQMDNFDYWANSFMWEQLIP